MLNRKFASFHQRAAVVAVIAAVTVLGLTACGGQTGINSGGGQVDGAFRIAGDWIGTAWIVSGSSDCDGWAALELERQGVRITGSVMLIFGNCAAKLVRSHLKGTWEGLGQQIVLKDHYGTRLELAFTGQDVGSDGYGVETLRGTVSVDARISEVKFTRAVPGT